MTEETKQPYPTLNYAAHLLKRLTDSNATDPDPEDLKRLTGPLFKVVMSVYSEGRDKAKRKATMKAELSANDLDLVLQPMIDLANPQAELSAFEISSGWQPFDLADVMKEDIPPIEWVVKFFLPRPSVIAIFGRPKHKKTMVALDMCHHVASGISWMTSAPDASDGIEVTPARIVWVDLENGSNVLKRRMKAFAKALDVQIMRGQFQAYSMPDPWPDLSKPENVISMIERIKILGDIGVLVIDHLGQVFGPIDENSPLASQVMGGIRQISESCNIAIILIHHAKKGNGKDTGLIEDQLRGSGAILAGVDAAFLVERDLIDKNQVTIKPVAVRGPDAPNISANFSFEQDPKNLDLTSARFWRIAYRNISARAHDAIIQALKENGKLNHTKLRASAKKIDASLSDANIRDAIATLEGTGEISYTKADKGAKIYELAGENEDD
jgi:AAA domain-containing protein